jgi:hypothetical protein
MALFSKKQADIPRRRQASSLNEPSQRATEQSLEERYAFRRNRTITGSASSRVVSTNESGAQLKSDRVKAHELARQRRKLGVVFVFVLLSAGLIGGLISQFTDGVVVHATDRSTQLDDSYGRTIEAYLGSQPIERLRFLLNRDHLNEYLQAANPEVANVNVDGSAGFGKSAFTLTLRQPIAGWSIDGTQKYVDTSGTAFVRNYFSTPAVQIVDNSGVQVAAGQAVASNHFLSFVGRIVGQANAKGFHVTQVVIPQGTTRQVELHVKEVGYPIKLSVDRPAGEQVEDMTRSLTWLGSHEKNPKYLDVRVSGRAFYYE